MSLFFPFAISLGACLYCHGYCSGSYFGRLFKRGFVTSETIHLP
jgi:hypothetical protein